mmetsp:Transcript_18519/g.22231  ORF Transcript_18519/g.22231 Transcript_18519/m.22231 type:complete len:109 (-) Transcript_18519:89-415(-)
METNDEDNDAGGQQVHEGNNNDDDVNVVGMPAEDGEVNEIEDYPVKDDDGNGEGNHKVYSGAAPREDTTMTGTEVKISSEVPPPNDDDNYGDDEGEPEDDEEDGEILE